ncbi:MAG: hypothetical protein L0Y38_06335 [Methylococcaceae bacterium]|nr:hypothetical protein [Methylococcaceae bacterium]MCI0667287.1 hypothetical protein [Methylococcaceae bacterium]MCI0733425.1 hypothetical protein [Methylococcaceae bacterium]
MIQISSLLAVFMVEGLAAAILLIAAFAVFIVRRRAGERNAAGNFISHLKQAEAVRSKLLGKAISESCDLEQGKLNAVLAEVNSCEKSLYRKVVQMFLNRDAALLNGIDQSVQALTHPFCRLLSEVSEKSREDPELAAAMESAKAEIERLKQESQRISKQLSMAMETMDEISSEYSKIFGASKEAEELDMSRKRMLNTYLRAEERMTKAFSDQ